MIWDHWQRSGIVLKIPGSPAVIRDPRQGFGIPGAGETLGSSLGCVPASLSRAGQAPSSPVPFSSLLPPLFQEDFDSEQLSVLASCLQELFKAHFRGEVLPEEITEE